MQTGIGGDIHDIPVRLPQTRECSLGQINCSLEICINQRIQFLRSNMVNRPLFVDSCRIDKDVKCAAAGHGFLNSASAVLREAHVSRTERCPLCPREEMERFAPALLITPHEYDLCAGIQKDCGGRTPDAGCPSGNQRCLPGKCIHGKDLVLHIYSTTQKNRTPIGSPVTLQNQFTESFRALPALNTGDLEAGMSISLPVCGLRPLRALRPFTSNVPKPIS